MVEENGLGGVGIFLGTLIYWLEANILFVCLGLGTLVGCVWIFLFREKIEVKLWMIPLLSILNSMAGLICVKVFAGIENWGSPLSSGQSLFGGVLLLPIVYVAAAKVFRRRLCDVFDVFAMCTITTLLFARVACVFSGCCYGKLILASESVRWPTRELEILFYLVLLVFLYRKNHQNSLPGEIWPIYMISYGTFRFVEEWLREGDLVLGPFHYGHIWAVLSIIIGISIYFELRHQKNVKKTN